MNWKAEAKEKLCRYAAMRLATVNIPEELSRLKIDAQAIRAAKFDDPAVDSGCSKREEALLNNIIHRQELSWTLQQAQRWLTSTDRALSALSAEERLILHRLYMYPEKYAPEQLCQELNLEKSSVYRRRDKALQHFTVAYYGVTEI